MLDVNRIDLDDVAMALEDQTDYEHRWLIDPRTGEILLWTRDTGIDGSNPDDLDELDLIAIDSIPSYVWYQGMVDFAEGISYRAASDDFDRALDGRGAFRRFKRELYERHPELAPVWHSLHEARGRAGQAGCAVGPGRVRLVHYPGDGTPSDANGPRRPEGLGGEPGH